MSSQENSGLQNLWNELKRRRVIRVVMFYAIAGWIVIEVSSTVLPNLNLPAWSVTLVTALVVLGFIPSVILAWAFDIGPGGVHKTPAQTEEKAGEDDDSEPVVARKQKSDKRRSIAVLPFVNMSGDDENEYFSVGVAEEILNLLTRLPQLRLSLIHISEPTRRTIPSRMASSA